MMQGPPYPYRAFAFLAGNCAVTGWHALGLHYGAAKVPYLPRAVDLVCLDVEAH